MFDEAIDCVKGLDMKKLNHVTIFLVIFMLTMALR